MYLLPRPSQAPVGATVEAVVRQVGSAGKPIAVGRGPIVPYGLRIPFDDVKQLNGYTSYAISLTLVGAEVPVTFEKYRFTHETAWDDMLPVRVLGFDPYGGMYEGDLRMEMYAPDEPRKLEEIVTTMEKSDYLFLSSNRQWASVGRLPQHYPMAHRFYRMLLGGCPPERDLLRCYADAEPRGVPGDFGYELVKVFDSYPTLGAIEFNDQLADESFSVYDHPKVMIFQKGPGFSAAALRAGLMN